MLGVVKTIPNSIDHNPVRGKTIAPLLGYASASGPFWRMVEKEDVPRYAVNKRVILFKVAEVEEWLATRRMGGSL